MRLIDADRLLTDRMKSKYYNLPNGDIAIPIIDIKNAPIIDAIEVVRCKDCIYWYSGDMGTGEVYEPYCEMLDTETEDYMWCSYGKRKEEGEDEE